MKKYILFLLIGIVSLGCITGCKQEKKEETKEIENRWHKTITPSSGLTEEEKTLFEEAKEGYTGLNLDAIALLAKQEDYETNYMFLCKGTTISNRPVISLKMVLVSKAREEKAAIKEIKEFDLSSYAGKDVERKRPAAFGCVVGCQICRQF